MSIYIAKTGLIAQEKQLGNIANNLANVNTFGFQRKRVEFEELMYQTERSAGNVSGDEQRQASGVYHGTGVRVAATTTDFSMGQLVATDRELDIAIEGKGFIQVTMPSGETGYTRNGALQRNELGELVTAQGYQVFPLIEIPIEASKINIANDGRIYAELADNSQYEELGQLELATFTSPEGLRPVGRGIYLESEGSGTAQLSIAGEDGAGGILQGILEGSNVSVMNEMIAMMDAQRAFEVSINAVRAVDDMQKNANQALKA